jgi:hypothetical protein
MTDTSGFAALRQVTVSCANFIFVLQFIREARPIITISALVFFLLSISANVTDVDQFLWLPMVLSDAADALIQCGYIVTCIPAPGARRQFQRAGEWLNR